MNLSADRPLPQEFKLRQPTMTSRIGIEGVELLPVGTLHDQPRGQGGRQPLGQLRLAGRDGPGDGHVAVSGVQMFQQPAMVQPIVG